MRLGVIADDFTGGTDIASFLVKNGMNTVQFSGIPERTSYVEADAIVISLKSRSIEAALAVNQSLSALAWLKTQQCTHFYFKYCSTFDSTPKGNIGPVTDALMQALNVNFTVIAPALPVNGRTVYQGHLFVFEQLLNESGMRHHPINPMTDSNLLNLMNQQSSGKTGLVSYMTIEEGQQAIQQRFETLKMQDMRYVVLDSVNNQHLETLASACQSMTLWTGGSGFAGALAKTWNTASAKVTSQNIWAPKTAKTVVLSGSCSEMTNQQVNHYRDIAPYFELSVERCLTDIENYVDEIITWFENVLEKNLVPPMIYATRPPDVLKTLQDQFGVTTTSQAIESCFAKLAHILKQKGVRNFIVAGGETSGVVTQALAVTGFYIGPEISPGVPWVKAIDSDIYLTLKSGNFGQPSFFSDAQRFFI